jgi:hypothetical protein
LVSRRSPTLQHLFGLLVGEGLDVQHLLLLVVMVVLALVNE